LQLTLNRAKAEIEKATVDVLNQQKYIATEVTLHISFSSFADGKNKNKTVCESTMMVPASMVWGSYAICNV